MPRSLREPGLPSFRYGEKRKYEVCDLTGCWIWMGAWNAQSRRGKVRDDSGRLVEAYVYFWEKKYNRRVPAGKMLGHICENSICCNPDHVVPCDSHENCPINQWHSDFWRSLSDIPF